MQVTCWGTRGSIPVTGPNFSVFGGDTLCIEVRSSANDIVLFDTGSGVQNINHNFKKDSPHLSVVYTHYHFDHILGLSFLKCLFDEKYSIDFYGPLANCEDPLESTLNRLISAPFSPFKLTDTAIVKAKLSYTDITENLAPFTIGALTITPIAVQHSNCGTVGYKVQEGENTFILLTDNELDACPKELYDSLVDFTLEADLLFIDSQFTAEEYKHHISWGHSSIESVISFAQKAQVETCGFLHYDPKRTDDEILNLYEGHSTEDISFLPLKQGQTFQLG